MKKEILKIAGVKSEKEFYKKYPTEEAFMKAHGKAFKKAAMGKSIVKKQLTQLTDFANPPQAEYGDYIGGESAGFKPVDFNETIGSIDSSIGVSDQMQAMQNKIAYQKQEQSMQQAGQQQKGGSGGIDPQQAMQLAMMFGKRGVKVPKYQNSGDPIPSAVDSAFNLGTPMDMSGATNANPYTYQNLNPQPIPQMPVGPGQSQQQSGKQKSLATTSGGLLVDDIVSTFGGPLSKPAGQIINAGRKINQSIKQAQEARQAGGLAKLALQASSTRPEETKRRYDRPEDSLVQPGQVGNAYGTDMSFLAKNGMQVGGNLTEIQNMYNPGDLYMDLGYEPMDDSNQVKQYRKGGKLKTAADGQGLLNIGSNPMFDQIGKSAQAVGDVASGFIDMGTERRMKKNQQLLGQAAFQQGAQSLQNQYSSVMEDGGYLSNDWQPQLITKFGDYDVKDLLASPKDADMLRAGGHIKSYTPPSQRAMETMALGGQLKTTWGGYAEPISQNPYLPGSGETVMFRGKSHEESDGNGHTGIGVKYGQGAHDSYTNYAEYGTSQADADVEVERGEPAVELPDSETGDLSMVVFGNMKIPSYGVSELGDDKAKGKKFKHYAADLSKKEKKAEKTKDKALTIIDDVDGNSPFDVLKLNTGKVMLQGADAIHKEIADRKTLLAGIQNAILDTAEEMGLESDALAKNKIKPAKDSDMAKFGAKLETAQKGKKKKSAAKSILPKWVGPTAAQLAAEEAQFRRDNPEPEARELTLGERAIRAGFGPRLDPMDLQDLGPLPTAGEIAAMDAKIKAIRDQQSKSLSDKAIDAYNTLYPYIKPGIQNPLDPNQLAGEMYALSTNQLEPVGAQQIIPMLEEVPMVSFQDQLNEIQAQTNAAMRLTGDNPAAQAMIASQASAAKNKVLAEQFRTNQAMQTESRLRNIATLKDTTIKNFGIIDQQQQRQSQARSATKAQAQEALSSIAEKIGKNKAETLSANVMANMYPQYSWGPQGRIYSTGTTQFNIPTIADYTPEELQKIIDAEKIKESKKKKRNGSIVKAIKNL
jgi:hypothetical protein